MTLRHYGHTLAGSATVPAPASVSPTGNNLASPFSRVSVAMPRSGMNLASALTEQTRLLVVCGYQPTPCSTPWNAQPTSLTRDRALHRVSPFPPSIPARPRDSFNDSHEGRGRGSTHTHTHTHKQNVRIIRGVLCLGLRRPAKLVQAPCWSVIPLPTGANAPESSATSGRPLRRGAPETEVSTIPSRYQPRRLNGWNLVLTCSV